MTHKPIYHSDDEGESSAGDDVYEECEICHQEFGGTCPINSADCPYADMVEEEEDEDPDFEDVKNLDVLIGDDEEVEKIIEEDAKIPLEDLVDEDAEPEKSPEDDSPSKTVEELEEEKHASRKKKRGPKHASAKKKKK